MKVVNNICGANPNANKYNRALVDTGQSNRNNVWRNNLAFDGTVGHPAILVVDTPSTISVADGNLLGMDPLFVDMKAGNLKLKPASPAVRKGCTDYGMPKDDLAGGKRSRPPNLGAYDSSGRR